MSINSEPFIDEEAAFQPNQKIMHGQVAIEVNKSPSRNEKLVVQEISHTKTQYKPKRKNKQSNQWEQSEATDIVILQDEETLPSLNRRKIVSSADKTSSRRTKYFEQERIQQQQQSNQKLVDRIMKKIIVKKQKSVSGFIVKKEGRRKESNRSEGVINKDQSQDFEQQDTSNIRLPSQQSTENFKRQRSLDQLPNDQQAIKSRRQIIQEELSKYAGKQPVINKFIGGTHLGMHPKMITTTVVSQNIPIKNPNLVKNNNFTQDKVEVKIVGPPDLPDIQAYSKRQYQYEIDSQLMRKDQKQMLGISQSQTKIVTDLSHMYERGKLRKHYVKLTQVHSLPEERRVLMQKQGHIKGSRSEYLVEVSKTKHKFYFTAVKFSNPHEYQVIELYKKQGEKLLLHVGPNDFLQYLEFANGKKLIIRDLDKILQSSASPDNSPIMRKITQLSRDTIDNTEMPQPQTKIDEQISSRKAPKPQPLPLQVQDQASRNDGPKSSSIQKQIEQERPKPQVIPRIKSTAILAGNQEQQISSRKIQVLNPEKRRQNSYDNLPLKTNRSPSQGDSSFKKEPIKNSSKSPSRKSSVDEQPNIKLNQFSTLNSLKRRIKKDNKSVIDLNKLIKIKQNGYKGPLFTIKERSSDDYGTFKVREKMPSPQKAPQLVKSLQGTYSEGLQQYDNTPMQSPLKEQQVDDEPIQPNNISLNRFPEEAESPKLRDKPNQRRSLTRTEQPERIGSVKSSQMSRKVIPRSKISPPVKQQPLNVVIYNTQMFLEEQETQPKVTDVTGQRMKVGRHQIVEDTPGGMAFVKARRGSQQEKALPHKVIELGIVQLGFSGPRLQTQQLVVDPTQRLQQLKFNMRIHKECTINIELQSNSVQRRLLLSTNINQNIDDSSQLLDEPPIGSKDSEEIYQSVSSSKDLRSKMRTKQNTLRIPLDQAKLKGKWQIICVDFDRLLSNEVQGERIKVTSIDIQAPLSRLYDIQGVYVPQDRNHIKNNIQKKLQVSSSTTSFNATPSNITNKNNQVNIPDGSSQSGVKRQRRAYVNQEDQKSELGMKEAQPSQASFLQKGKKGGPKSYSLNSRQPAQLEGQTQVLYTQQEIEQSLLSQMKTPQNIKVQELPQLVGGRDLSGMKKQLKTIHEKVSKKDEQQQPRQQRYTAKSAVISSQKFKKTEEASDNELIDPQSQGVKFIQKMTERQKRMEEKYFKKDGPKSNQANPTAVPSSGKSQQIPSKKPQPKLNPTTHQQMQRLSKMTNTAVDGFRNQSENPQPQQIFQNIMNQTQSQLDFKKSCTFSSTLRNFAHREREEQKARVDQEAALDESIDEEICQSQRDEDGNQQHQSGQKPKIGGKLASKPPQHHMNIKQGSMLSRESNLTGGTLGMGLNGAQSTRSTSIKTPMMFGGGNRLNSVNQAAGVTQYSQMSGVPQDQQLSLAAATNNDYYKFNTKDIPNNKLIFSPATANEGHMTEDEGGLLSDRDINKTDPQRYTQNIFAESIAKDEAEEDGDLYVVDVAIQYKATFGMERRPSSPPLKIQ